jgi:sugar phosphate permease
LSDAARLEARAHRDTRQVAQEFLYRRITWRLLPMILACYIVSYIDRVNISFARLQMLDDLGFSETAYGLGAGIFFIGFMIFEVPSNLLLYRLGPRLWIGRIMVTWGLLCVGMLFVKSPVAFCIMRLLLGAAEAGFLPGIVYYLGQWYPRERQGRIMALLLTGAVAGGVLGGPLSGSIMGLFAGGSGLHNWQWLFLLTGIPAVLLGVAFWFSMPNTPAELSSLSRDEVAVLGDNVARDRASAGIRSSRLADGFRERNIWLLGLIALTANLGIYGVVFWTPSIVKAAGFGSYTVIGLISALPYLAAGLLMLVLGYSSDRLKERRWHIASACVLGVAGQLISVHFKLMPILTVATAGYIGCTPLIWASAANFIKDEAAAVGFALINSLAAVGAFFGPYLMGIAKDATGNTDVAVYVMSAFALLGGLIALALPEETRSHAAAR